MFFIPDDSPLRNPPDSLPPAQKVAIDGLRYAADMIGLGAERLDSDLLTVSKAPQSDQIPRALFTSCVADAWSIIDNLWRLNLLLQRTPGLKRTPDVELHLRALRTVEDLRHGFQHLDERIAVCAGKELPLWGTLAWAYFPDGAAKMGRIFLMIPGALRSGTPSFLNPAGKPIRSAIDLVTLSAFGHDLELSALVRRVSTLFAGLDKGLRHAAGTHPSGGADALISADFVPGTAPSGLTGGAAGGGGCDHELQRLTRTTLLS
jgi:hypothetical protein